MTPGASKPFTETVKRIIFGLLLITGFVILILMGPIMMILLIVLIQVQCFSEVISVGYNHNEVPARLPYFRSLCWYFLTVTNYFFYIETVGPRFQDVHKNAFLRIFVTYHRFFSFCLYFIGIVLFVISLVRKRKLILRQFKILAWTHTLLIIVVLQAYLVMENMFQGLIWLILPHSLVILNDIFAYIFGRIMGKTPLIEVSPKKTWEGFIGGAFGTLLAGYVLSHVMCKFNYFTCPVESGISVNLNCERSYLFKPKEFFIFEYYPFSIHFVSLALFASLLAPFGGFFASGFKRACKIKDFGQVIPGHGGIMDRFDCHFLMGAFVNVYIYTFLKRQSVDLMFQKFLVLEEQDQVEFYNLLREQLFH